MDNRYENIVPPVKEGDELDVKVINVSTKGDGVAKHKGFIIFVPDTQIDDQVKILIKKVMPKFAVSEVTERYE